MCYPFPVFRVVPSISAKHLKCRKSKHGKQQAMSLIICRVDYTGGFCVLQSDISAQHLSMLGPLSAKEGNNLKNTSGQAKTSGFFEFHRRDLAGLV